MNTSEDLHQCFYSSKFKPIVDFTHQRSYDLMKDKECWERSAKVETVCSGKKVIALALQIIYIYIQTKN